MRKQQISNKKLTEEELDEVRQKMKDTPLEKNDVLAITIAAIITIMPLVLVLLGLFAVIIWLIFPFF
jgi:hypothetical protein